MKYKRLLSQIYYNRMDIAVALLIFLIVLLFLAIVNLRIHGFLLRSGDTAVAEQALYNTIHGSLFRQSFLNNQNNLHEHLALIQFFYLPFYIVLPKLITLYTVIAGVYGYAAYLFYQFIKQRSGWIVALWLSIFYLLNPIVIITNTGAMHVVAIAGPLFLLSLIYYENKRYFPWLICMLLVVITSEFLAPTVFLLGVLALLEKRTWRWYVPPMLLGVSMYVLSMAVITIGQAQNSSILKSFNNLSSLRGSLHLRLKYLEEFFRPTLYLLPFFSKYIALIIPSLLLEFVVLRSGRLQLGSHLFTLVPVILLFSVADLIHRKPTYSKAAIILLTAGSLLSISVYSDKVITRPSKNAEIMRQAVAMVKNDASVTSSRDMSYYLSHRSELYLTDNQMETDYVVLDLSESDSDPKTNNYVKSLLVSKKYNHIFNKNQIVVLSRK